MRAWWRGEGCFSWEEDAALWLLTRSTGGEVKQRKQSERSPDFSENGERRGYSPESVTDSFRDARLVEVESLLRERLLFSGQHTRSGCEAVFETVGRAPADLLGGSWRAVAMKGMWIFR